MKSLVFEIAGMRPLMSAAAWLALAGGLTGVAFVIRYLFAAGKAPVRTPATADGVREVTITVHGGYEPAVVRVSRGEPVRLVFDRQEPSACPEEVVFGDFGIRRSLPPFEKTAVELTPTEAGTYEFTCGLGVFRGRLIVE